MIEPKRRSLRPSGVTLVELMVATTISAIIAVLATQTYVSFIRDSVMRRKVTDVQGGARFTLEHLTRELRHASLSAGTGWIWATTGGNPVAYPSVQVFQNISGAGTLDLAAKVPGAAAPKAQTDALLVVEAFGNERAATVGELTGTPRAFAVTTTSTTTADAGTVAFLPGQPVLVGDYREASWGVIDVNGVNDSVTPPQITVATDLALPGAQVHRLAAGALVRRARARLYYVDARDQLVRLELSVPRAPQAASEIQGGEILATGFENMQLFCELSNGNGTISSYNKGAGTEVAFSFGAGGGASLVATDDPGTWNKIGNLRTIVLNVVARSATPLRGSAAGDGVIALDGVKLGDTAEAYVRRAYRFAIGVRNMALGDI